MINDGCEKNVKSIDMKCADRKRKVGAFVMCVDVRGHRASDGINKVNCLLASFTLKMYSMHRFFSVNFPFFPYSPKQINSAASNWMVSHNEQGLI